MFYLIFGILILLFYIFAAPQSIKGTLNVVVLVIALVAFIILLGLAVFQIFQLPSEFFIGILMIGVAYFSLRDISKLSQKDKKVSFRSKLRNRQE
ncbi:DUF3165 family protein [Streptococcus sp. IsoGale021]|uniref:DUF3165 family protein n=1 Tax=Streptococcus TaxID=1301 RepID=UPI002000F3D7|nr:MULTISPECIES: DUF3165 family protein [Streptococcus]MCY7210845.1 DUF3165 family protein [Streptococcus anginosus]MCY7212429.1 DUF3165 family protein [Streptococcus anginosus]MCY7226278.1 DUF3165 family protein [Streptococcus anginosus]MDQ8694620.1 DUF3165 family protein [Streptococcus sp. IsoGale021]MDU5128889.1 DUF3165 family protein [Streptococcus anginosus]